MQVRPCSGALLLLRPCSGARGRYYTYPAGLLRADHFYFFTISTSMNSGDSPSRSGADALATAGNKETRGRSREPRESNTRFTLPEIRLQRSGLSSMTPGSNLRRTSRLGTGITAEDPFGSQSRTVLRDKRGTEIQGPDASSVYGDSLEHNISDSDEEPATTPSRDQSLLSPPKSNRKRRATGDRRSTLYGLKDGEAFALKITVEDDQGIHEYVAQDLAEFQQEVDQHPRKWHNALLDLWERNEATSAAHQRAEEELASSKLIMKQLHDEIKVVMKEADESLNKEKDNGRRLQRLRNEHRERGDALANKVRALQLDNDNKETEIVGLRRRLQAQSAIRRPDVIDDSDQDEYDRRPRDRRQSAFRPAILSPGQTYDFNDRPQPRVGALEPRLYDAEHRHQKNPKCEDAPLFDGKRDEWKR